jgi:hypothetical protein
MTSTDKAVSRRTVMATLFERGHRRIIVSILPGDVIGFRLERMKRTYYAPIAALADQTIRRTILNERKAAVAARKAAKR